MMTDPIADMITRIRNANKAKFETVDIPSAKMKVSIAKILRDEGYIRNYSVVEDNKQGVLRIQMKYGSKGAPVITEIKRVSKPSCRVYVNKSDVPMIRNGLGLAIISTSKGVLSDKEARRQQVGGEVICTFW